MQNRELQYFMHNGPAAVRLELAGDLNNQGARELNEAWRAASAGIGKRTLIVDMTFITSVEGDGRVLLAAWHAEGAQIIAGSNASRELAEAVVGKPLRSSMPPANSLLNWTWLPIGPSTVLTSNDENVDATRRNVVSQ